MDAIGAPVLCDQGPIGRPDTAKPIPSLRMELVDLAFTRSRSDTESPRPARKDGEEEPMRVEQRLEELGLVLPEPPQVPPGFQFPFSWVRVWDGKAYVSGHSAQAPDGSFAGPFGKVPIEVSSEAAQEAARKTALSMLGSLKRALGDLDRVTAWLMVYGMVNADPGYSQTTSAINGFSNLIIDLYGPEIGAHARVAVGMAALPLDNAVVIAAEVAVAD